MAIPCLVARAADVRCRPTRRADRAAVPGWQATGQESLRSTVADWAACAPTPDRHTECVERR